MEGKRLVKISKYLSKLLRHQPAMQQAGFNFYCSDNGVWLVDHVPYEFLTTGA